MRSRATCHPDRPVNGRGLCKTCYERHRRVGTLEGLERRRPPVTALLDEAYRLRAMYPNNPLTWNEIAARLGVQPKSLYHARWRRRNKVHGIPELRRDTRRDLLDEDPNLFLDEGEEPR